LSIVLIFAILGQGSAIFLFIWSVLGVLRQYSRHASMHPVFYLGFATLAIGMLGSIPGSLADEVAVSSLGWWRATVFFGLLGPLTLVLFAAATHFQATSPDWKGAPHSRDIARWGTAWVMFQAAYALAGWPRFLVSERSADVYSGILATLWGLCLLGVAMTLAARRIDWQKPWIDPFKVLGVPGLIGVILGRFTPKEFDFVFIIASGLLVLWLSVAPGKHTPALGSESELRTFRSHIRAFLNTVISFVFLLGLLSLMGGPVMIAAATGESPTGIALSFSDALLRAFPTFHEDNVTAPAIVGGMLIATCLVGLKQWRRNWKTLKAARSTDERETDRLP
jgi:hypothetical protein